MKRFLLLAILTIVIFSLLPKNVYARSGCCSHHGGVCGCGCCDGTGLSSTCAPYYPECSEGNSGETPIYIPEVIPTRVPPTSIPTRIPTQRPLPTRIPTTIPTPTSTPKPTLTPTPKTTVTQTPTPTEFLTSTPKTEIRPKQAENTQSLVQLKNKGFFTRLFKSFKFSFNFFNWFKQKPSPLNNK